jgi:hypothetical protein
MAINGVFADLDTGIGWNFNSRVEGVRFTVPMLAVRKLLNFLGYLFRKKSELKRINQNDALLAKVVVDIHRKRLGSDFRRVPLHLIAARLCDPRKGGCVSSKR